MTTQTDLTAAKQKVYDSLSAASALVALMKVDSKVSADELQQAEAVQLNAVATYYAVTGLQDDIFPPPVVIPPPVTPPVPTPLTTPPLVFYGNGGSYQNAENTGKQLGVVPDGVTTYCLGDTWADIMNSGWTATIGSPLPSYIGVNLVPNGGDLTQTPPAGTFTNLAKSFKVKTRVRPGWEPDGNWYTWGYGAGGSRPKVNTVALYKSRFRDCVGQLRLGCPSVLIDWCTNAGSSTLQQLRDAYPDDDVVDSICFDHYDAGTEAANLAAVTAVIQFAAERNKPISIGEFGAGNTDNVEFIDFMALLINNLPAFCAKYKLPVPPGIVFAGFFTDSDNNITNKPKMIAEFPKAFVLDVAA